MSKKEEFYLFKNWDDIYRNIRKEKLLKGLVTISPADTRELYLGNVVEQVLKDHNTTRTIGKIG